jgi:hypothetical protein
MDRFGWGCGVYIVFFANPFVRACPLALPLPLLFAALILSSAWKVRAMVRTLLTSRTDAHKLASLPSFKHSQTWNFVLNYFLGVGELTAREHHPDEVHEEIVAPEVQELGARVRDLRVVVVEHAGCVVEDQAVDLADADDDLERVSEGVRVCDEEGYDEADGAPGELFQSRKLAN